jgi:hypothetical protein
VDETNSGSCALVSFSISRGEPLGPDSTVFVIVCIAMLQHSSL